MEELIVDASLRLIPYYRDDEVSLPWYQDPDVCRQVDGRSEPYTLERLHRMYDYLCARGECYFIACRGVPIGDVTLLDNGELAIVVSKAYQNRHIGRRCVRALLARAREKGMDAVRANVYSFNAQSRQMFLSAGFTQTAEEWLEYRL